MGALGLSSPNSVLADNLGQYLRPAPGGATFEILVRGAHCANCIAKIERGMVSLSGVSSARLNLSTGKLVVAGEALNPPAILKRLTDLGYEARPFDAGEAMDADESEGRFLLHCLAVSGFATVFVMGLTDSIWYGGHDLSPAMHQSFFWLAGAVAIPASLYSGWPFFRAAWRGLKARRTGMDFPISIALLLSLGLSLYQASQNGPHTYFDAAIMLTFLLLVGRYLDFRLRDKARDAARHLLALQSLLVRRLGMDEKIETVAARDLAPGDRVLLACGDRVPVNGTLEDHGSEFDLALVTGEITPQNLAAGAAIEAGAIVTGAPVILRATARVENSLVADLARLLEAGQQSRSLYVKLADRAARAYVPLVLSIALAVLAGWLAAGASLVQAATSAITVLIITCPCALGLAVPAVQIVATGRLFQKGVFVKSGDALERLATITRAVFDKTGTLTLGAPVLSNVRNIPADILARAASMARASRHPFARALAEAAGPGTVAGDISETAGMGLERGSGATLERLGNAQWCGAGAEPAFQLWYRLGQSAPVGFQFEDSIRPESQALMTSLIKRGIAVEMLTGDKPEIAAVIARQAGITEWRAGVGPVAKADRLKALRAEGQNVLMVGDGINDAAAMALATVSIAPGSATDLSQRASDMVLRGVSITPILEAVDVARKARRLVLQNFALAALYNFTAIPMAAMGIVTPLIAAATMAGSSLLVTLNALRLSVGKAS